MGKRPALKGKNRAPDGGGEFAVLSSNMPPGELLRPERI